MFHIAYPLLATALIASAAPAAIDDAATNPYALAHARTALLRDVGRAIFFDPSFSLSGKQACASCHAPQRRYSPPNARDVQLGGAHLRAQGLRAPPTLTYLDRIPPYANHHYDSEDEADDSIDNGPTGGLNWDGRVDTGAEQAATPLTAAFEMANTRAGVATAVRRARYAGSLRQALGEDSLDDDAHAFAAVARALAAFENDTDEFSPYTSKYDAFLTGNASLSAQEQRGLALFEDEHKGNCAQCHRSRRGRDGTPPALSDYGLIALGVPRNANIARNHDRSFFDLGACGPERRDKTGQAEYCGLFRTPTLRNVALRSTFFHNGKFHDLREVIEFYVTRDITPERWYGKNASGHVIPYDDLPAPYHANINRDPPFAGQHPGAAAVLNEMQVGDIVAFLRTLTDGYLSENPYRAERLHATQAPIRAGQSP